MLDFEEYTWLYHEAWGEPLIRWLLASVSTSMVWDDHDMSDDWNISASWLEEMREKSWWHQRAVAGIISYWIYQHLGNLSPSELSANELYQSVRGDGTPPRSCASSPSKSTPRPTALAGASAVTSATAPGRSSSTPEPAGS